MAVLGVGLQETMQRNNATKNVLAMLVNGVAAVVFIAVAEVDWAAAGLSRWVRWSAARSARPWAAGCRRWCCGA